MRYLFALAAVFVLALAVLLGPTLQDALQARTDYQQQRRAIALERERLALEQARQWAPYTAPADLVFGWAIRLGFLAALVLIGWGIVDAYRQRRGVVRYGGLPISRDALAHDHRLTQATVAGTLAAQHERARHSAAVPERLTMSYAPKLASTNTPTAPALLHDVDALSSTAMPTFAHLLATNEIGPDQPLVLGYAVDTGEPIRGTIDTVSTGAIAGLSGGGKSTTTRGLFGQCALQGVRFVVGDPHGAAGGDAGRRTLAQTLAPLRRSFLCDVAIERDAILAAVQLVGSELERRKRGAPQPYRVLLALDEFSSLMRGDDELAHVIASVLESVATEGSKFGCYAWLLGHQWQASRSGGTELRSVLQSAYLHRMRPDTARAVTGLRSADVPDIARLEPGEAYFYASSGRLQRVRVPNTTSADLELVAQRLEVNMPSVGTRADVVLSPDEARIIELFRAGNDAAQVARIIDPKATTGGRMQQRSAEVQAVLRKVL